MDTGKKESLRAAVIGFGAYGRLHVRKYWHHPNARLVAVVDNDPDRRKQAEELFPGITTATDLEEVVDQIDTASVVVPAGLHHSIARRLINAGIHLLVEKPFTTSLEEAHDLIALSRAHGVTLQPGYLERFNLTLGELREHIPSPRYVEARRLTAWRGRGADVNVILDLMIHDIDMLLEIVDAPVTDVQARGVKIVTEHWDVVNAQLHFANGCIANLTASRASPVPERRLHVFSEDACALADVDGGEMLVHQRSDLEPGVMTERRFCRHEDPLGAEIDAFVQAVRSGAKPLVSAEDACRAMDIANRIVMAMEHDAEILDRTAMPLTDSDRAIAYLLERGNKHGIH